MHHFRIVYEMDALTIRNREGNPETQMWDVLNTTLNRGSNTIQLTGWEAEDTHTHTRHAGGTGTRHQRSLGEAMGVLGSMKRWKASAPEPPSDLRKEKNRESEGTPRSSNLNSTATSHASSTLPGS